MTSCHVISDVISGTSCDTFDHGAPERLHNVHFKSWMAHVALKRLLLALHARSSRDSLYASCAAFM